MLRACQSSVGPGLGVPGHLRNGPRAVLCRASHTRPPQERTAAQSSTVGRRAALAVLSGAAFSADPASAALKDYLVRPNDPIQEVAVQLGNQDGEFVFEPSTLEFTHGALTKLKLTNPTSVTHYFTAFEFAEKVYTVLVLAGDPAVEVKGGIQEVALKAGASATWIFVPMKPGKYPLRCTVKGHENMLGTIIVKRAA